MRLKSNHLFTNSTAFALGVLALTGCQSLHAKPKAVAVTPITTASPTASTPTAPQQVDKPTNSNTTSPTSSINQNFTINGKIGITTPKQTGSAFYVWTQQEKNFAIDIAGALNAGQTKISYNGQSATLTNEKGTINAASPEELLFQATGWQAPISQLPYWIQGQSAPSDSKTQQDSSHRLTNAQNGNWSAEFSYANATDNLPSRLTARHPDGYKVVLTINRLK